MDDKGEIGQYVADLTFTATLRGIKSTQSPVLKVLPRTVTLRFLRYTLANENNDNYIVWPEKDKFTQRTPQKAPAIKGYKYTTSMPCQGYIYIYFENKPKLFKEFEIDEGGYLRNIITDFKDDVRQPVNTDYTSYYCIEKNDIVYIAYSEFQWGAAFIKKIRVDASLRSSRMQKFVAADWINKKPQDDAFSIDDIDSYFPIESGDNKPTKTTYGTTWSIKEPGVSYQLQQWAFRYSDVEANYDNPDYKEDVFICLNDPLGCAKDLANHVAEGLLYFKALTDAIQTGENQNIVYERYKQGNFSSQAADPEYIALVRLALTCYQMVYNNSDTIDDYDGKEPGWLSGGYGLDKAKLEGILGCNERKKNKSSIGPQRDNLGNFITSDYLLNVLDDCLYCKGGILSGRATILEILKILYTNPSEIDRPLLLNIDRPGKEDKWQKLVHKLTDDDKILAEARQGAIKSKSPNYAGMDILYTLLSSGLNIDNTIEEHWASISNKVAQTIDAKLTFLAKQVFSIRVVNDVSYTEINDQQRFIVKRLNKNIKVHGEEMFEVRNSEIMIRLNEMGGELDKTKVKTGYYGGSKEDVLRILKKSEGVKLIESRHGQHELELPVSRTGKKLTDKDVKTNKLNRKASKILNSQKFTGTVAFLQVLNFQCALVSLAKERDFKHLINFSGTSAELTEASLRFYESLLKNSNKTGSSSIIESLAPKIKIAGIIGCGVTAIICFWDSFEALDRRDTDAAMAWAGAGAAFGTATIVAIFAGSSVAGPIGWIAAAVGLGFVLLAGLLTDTEIESFFKNFLLSDKTAFPKKSGETPMDYGFRVLKNRYKLMGDKDYIKTMMNPADAEATLFDMITCRKVIFTPTESKDSGYGYNPYTNPLNISAVTAYAFKAEIQFFRFFNYEDQVEYQVFFFPKGVKKGGAHEITAKRNVKKVEKPNGINYLEVSFSIPNHLREFINDNTDIVLALRLKVDPENNLYFPYPIAGKQRYLGARIKVIGTRMTLTDFIQNKDAKMAPLDELLTPEKW